MLLEILVSEFLTRLGKVGRDWHLIRTAITEFETEINRMNQSDEPWSNEFGLFLNAKVCEALDLAKLVAIDMEEFEWAHEITIRLTELGWEPDPNIEYKIIH